MPNAIVRWLHRANETGGIITFGDYVWRIGGTIAGALGAGVMGWIATQTATFWQNFGWLGVAGIALGTWYLIVHGFYLLTRRAVMKGLPARERGETPSPQVGGDTLQATGVVSAPTPFNPQGLYVGQIQVGMNAILDTKLIEIAITAFNATNRTVSLHKIDGRVKASRMNGSSRFKIGLLPFASGRSNPEDIKSGEEFRIIVEQRLTDEAAQQLAQASDERRLGLDFDEFHILMNANGSLEPIRLPLWDGVVVSVNTVFVTGRVKTMRAGPGNYEIRAES